MRAQLACATVFILQVAAAAYLPREQHGARRAHGTAKGPELRSPHAQLAMMLTSLTPHTPVSTQWQDADTVSHYLHSSSPVAASLHALQETANVSLGTGLELNFTISNPSNDQPLKVLMWDTPFEGLLVNLFDVRGRDGERLEYHGPDARRIPPETATADDFLEIPAGGHETVTVDIAEVYRFPEDGPYWIRVTQPYDGHIRYRDVMSTTCKVDVVGTAEQHELLGAEGEGEHQPPPASLVQVSSGGISTSNCDASQIAALQSMHDDAKSWLDTAKQCTSDNACSSNVDLWFGTASQSAYSFSVDTSVDRAKTNADNSIYVCNSPSCSSNVYAFVYPTDPQQHIYMCGLCFNDDVAASEKRQTVIHELVHFDHIGVYEQSSDVVGERDLAYGESNCQQLASTNPTDAMNNADNVGYFVRDIGTGSDPSCRDNSQQCPGWVSTYGCNSGATVGGVTLDVYCALSCSTCTPAVLNFNPTPAPTPAAPTTAPTAAPTPSPTPPQLQIDQAITITGLSPSDYSGDTKTVYEAAFAIGLGVYNINTQSLSDETVLSSAVADSNSATVIPEISFIEAVSPSSVLPEEELAQESSNAKITPASGTTIRFSVTTRSQSAEAQADGLTSSKFRSDISSAVSATGKAATVPTEANIAVSAPTVHTAHSGASRGQHKVTGVVAAVVLLIATLMTWGY